MNTPRRIAGHRHQPPPPAPLTQNQAPTSSDIGPPAEPVDATQASEPDDGPLVLYTPEQAAKMLQVRPSWLRRRAAARAVPCRFLGKHLRFAKQDIDEIAEAGRQPPRTA